MWILLGVALVLSFGWLFIEIGGSCSGIIGADGRCNESFGSYSGSSCSEIAAEWGSKVDQALLELFESQGSVSAQMWDTAADLSAGAGHRINQVGLHGECDPDRFFDKGEMEFSVSLKEQVGLRMYDNDVVRYDTWKAEARNFILLLVQIPPEETADVLG